MYDWYQSIVYSMLLIVAASTFDITSHARKRRGLLILANNHRATRTPFHSFVEGDSDDNGDSFEEIESLGGDLFFLGEEVYQELTNSYESNKLTDRYSRHGTDGLGPSPKPKNDFLSEEGLWDGTIDEEAHFDLQ